MDGIPTQRAFLTATFNNSYWIGAIIAGAITYGMKDIPNNWSWRIPSIVFLTSNVLISRSKDAPPCFQSCVFHSFQNLRVGYSIRGEVLRSDAQYYILTPCRPSQFSSSITRMVTRTGQLSALKSRRYVRPWS